MPLATTRRRGLVDQVIEQMRTAIAAREWRIDERIPTESELVARLGVARNTVREAIRALAHAGVLEVRQGDGTYVRATSELSGALRRLCGSELRDIIEARLAIEVEAARLAARRRSATELATATRILAKRDKAMRNGEIDSAVEADARFHTAIVDASHNAVLVEMYRGLTEAVRTGLAMTMPEDISDLERVSHDGLLEAIAQRDPERAAAETATFLVGVLDRFAACSADQPAEHAR